MKRCISPLFLALLLQFSAMGTAQDAKTSVDYHTTVERLFHLQQGMTLLEVNETLTSEPHDLLQNTEGGYLMLEYRYLKSYRKVKTSEVDTESGRIVGSPHYADAASVYLLFDNESRLVSYVTADALGDIEHQYRLETTARRLGSRDAPCTRDCRMDIPRQSAEECAEVEVVLEVVFTEGEDVSKLDGLLDGVRARIAGIGNSGSAVEEPVVLDEGVEMEDTLGSDSILVGDAVWVIGEEGRSSGVVMDELSSGVYLVRYVDLMSGEEVDRELKPNVLKPQD